MTTIGGTRIRDLLAARAAVDVTDIATAAVTISRIPYGRASRPSPRVVVAEWRGTCSAKHLLFAAVAAELDPLSPVRLVHRLYRVSHDDALQRWGPRVASTVPTGGLVDVHTYAQVVRDDRVIAVDVTFPLGEWDGETPLPLACGPGQDFQAGEDPLATKSDLVRRLCDPAVREPFIAALSQPQDGGPEVDPPGRRSAS